MIRLYKFNKEKPKSIIDKSILLLCCTALCSLGFGLVSNYFLDTSIADIFFKGAMFYSIILVASIICKGIQIVKEVISAQRNGVNLHIFWNTTDIVKSFNGCSLESLLSKYDGYYDYEGENVMCIYNQFRYKILIDSNHIIQDILQGYNVSELKWVEKYMRDLHIRMEKERTIV